MIVFRQSSGARRGIGENMKEDAMVLLKFLYVAFFEKVCGGVLLITKEDGSVSLPGEKVTGRYLHHRKDETWIRVFIARIMEDKFHVEMFFKNGEEIYIKDGIQPMPATYSVYPEGCEEEHSVVIVGSLNHKDISGSSALFYNFASFMILVRTGKVNFLQEKLILRVFASRDYPIECERIMAGEELKAKHE